MGRKKKGDGGHGIAIWVYGTHDQIISSLKTKGDTRTISEIYTDALVEVYGRGSFGNGEKVERALRTKDRYFNRAKAMVQSRSTYLTMQTYWIEANIDDFKILYPGKSIRDIYDILEIERKERVS